MVSSASTPRRIPLLAHVAVVLVGLPILYALPPDQGRILLVPLTDDARHAVARLAIANGARLMAAGPWPGSLVVDGRGDRMAPALLERGIVSLSARIGGCGGESS